MNTEMVQVETTLPKIGLNFAESKARLEEEVAQYNVVVTADTVGDSKKLATELNKRAGEIDALRKEAIVKVSAPIKEFDERMQELVGLCKDGRQKILDQVKRFEDETRKQAESLLTELRQELRDAMGVDPEFYRAEFDDLIKISAVTAAGNLTKGARDTLESRVRDDKALQDQTKMRLLELENRSYKAGLDAPLTRDHVRPFLLSDDDTYERELGRILDAEVERQKVAEQRSRERYEREQRQQEESAKADAERKRRLESHATMAGPDPHRHPAGDTEPPKPTKTAAPGKVGWVVTCTFETEAAPSVAREAIETELRRVLAKAGISTLTAVRAFQTEEAA